MDTKALRQKILDLAIKGKLVPQDPNDEPASVLLEKIRAEKQQMVKDDKLKPKDIKNDTIIFKGEDSLHYEKFPDGTVKCIEDKIPFELPEGWEWARIGNLFTTVTGSTPSTKDTSLYGDEFPFYKPTDLDKGINVVSSTDYVSEKGYNSGRVLPEKSVLVTCIGATIGKTGMIHKTGICNQQINAIIPNNFALPEFTFFLLSSLYMQEQILTNSSATTLPILNKSKFDSLLIPLTPLVEQKRIVRKLTDLLSFIDTIESDKTDLQTTIQLTKSKILDLAIRGQLVPQNPNDEPASVLLDRIRAEKEKLIKQGRIKRNKKESVIFKGEDNSYYEKIGDTVTCIDEELPFELPDGWIWCRGSSCFLPMESRKPSGTYFKYIDIDSIDNKHQAIKEAKITETAKAPSRANRAVFDGSILFSLVRPYLKNIALVDSNNADSIASTGFYIATSNGTFIPKYLYILMISAYVVDGLNQFMKGDNSPSISKDNIEKWLYPVPPIAEQEKIANTVQKHISIIEDIEKSLS